jgi:magnesium chelatase family protein
VLASVATFALEGVRSREVTVEVDVRRGLPAFAVVGLPDPAVREARERVRAALLNSGLEFPLKRLTANLAPAHVRKAGPGFDLALAVALLAASGQIPAGSAESCALCGELSLGGALRPVRGALAMADGARRAGYRRLVVPAENAGEAALVDDVDIVGVPSLARLVEFLHGRWHPASARPAPADRSAAPALDLTDVRGQEDAKRALEIAAAGGHNLLMIGPPGSGKTMLARRLPGILPPPRLDEALEVTRIHSVAGLSGGRLVAERPFRAPHHTISASGLVGGGSLPRPGEVTLAHRGVLFLDELGEFSRVALEALRQPLEDGRVEVMRGQRSIAFPAACMVVAACNGCPCARPRDDCTCTAADRGRYERRLSGPLLDRMDLVCHLDPATASELLAGADACESSSAVRGRVAAARERAAARLAGTGGACNADMDARLTRRHVRLGADAGERLGEALRQTSLSARGNDRVLRIARTLADLGDRDEVAPEDVDEALSFRLGAQARAGT